jgi:acyl-CoA reductase-like NAD-dependent aldehyde dehydrogenase
LQVGSPAFPEVPIEGWSNSEEEIDEALATLTANKSIWATLGGLERIVLLEATLRGMEEVASDWVRVSLDAKRAPAGGFPEGEEWVILSAVPQLIRALRESLKNAEIAGGHLAPPTASHDTEAHALRTFPRSTMERLLFMGTSAEVLVQASDVRSATAAREDSTANLGAPGGRVALVLGAGNVSAIPPVDVLNKLFLENQTVILKMSAVNAYLGPLIERGFHELISAGYLRVVYGGADVGGYLCQHPSVDTVHITGSDKSFEAIVFGPGEDGARRKSERRPLLSKPITSELGCVSPVIVVPGPWTPGEIHHQAVQISTWLASNAGFNCMTPRVLVQHRTWSKRQDLLDALGDVLSKTPTRSAYYPGAEARHAEFLGAHPDALLFARDRIEGHLPWTLVTDLDAANADDPCFTTEAFCSLLGETALDAPDAAAFVERAVRFVNETLWGTLSATIIVHPRSMRDPAVGPAIEAAIGELRYGTVGLNVFPGYAYVLMATPWGAYPASDIYDVQSGMGFVNDVLGIGWPEKTVYRGPFMKLDPATVLSKRPHEFGRKLAQHAFDPSIGRFASMLGTAMRSG